MKKFLPALLSITIACQTQATNNNEPDDAIDEPNEGNGDTGDEVTVGDADVDQIKSELVDANWPSDLVSVVFYATDAGPLVVFRNAVAQPIALLELVEAVDEHGEPDQLGMVAVTASFSDGAIEVEVETHTMVVVKSEVTGDIEEEQAFERLDVLISAVADVPEAVTWWRCAAAVAVAILACLPSGGLLLCPEAVHNAVCECAGVRKKAKNKPKPEGCDK